MKVNQSIHTWNKNTHYYKFCCTKNINVLKKHNFTHADLALGV